MKTRKILPMVGLGFAGSLLMAGTALAGGPGYAPHAPSLLPGNPQAGECYARVKIPAQYETRSQSVIVADGYSTIDVVQPELRTRQESVMVKEASVEYRVRQPRYETVTEQVLVRSSYDKLSVTPPRFSNVTETIRVSEPRLVWKKGNPAKLRQQGYVIHSTADGGYAGQGYGSTTQYGQSRVQPQLCGTVCEIWCLVEEPGQTVSYNRKVMTSPGEVRRTPVPAKYSTITKRVVADPGGVEEIPVPAEYRTIMVEDVVNPGGERHVNVPPKYGEVAAKVPVSAERYEWRRVVCQPGTQQSRTSSSTSGYSSGSSHHSSGTATYGSGYATGGSAYTSGSSRTYQGSGTSYQGSGASYGHMTNCGTQTSCTTYSNARREKYRYRR